MYLRGACRNLPATSSNHSSTGAQCPNRFTPSDAIHHLNITTYIQSGAIECCVLGQATEDEQQELVALCRQYPEVLEARVSFELVLEAHIMKETVAPPAALKEKIFAAVLNDASTSAEEPERRTPATPVQRVSVTPVLGLNRWKWLAAACVIAAMAILFWVYRLSTENKRLQIVNTELNNRLDHSNHADALLALKPVLAKPSVVWSMMIEPENTAHCAAHIYWDTLSTRTYLLLGNIPSLLTTKQFQLWAITDGRPVSLGTFDIGKEGQLLQMNPVQKATSFIITVEPKGGSAQPTTKETYAISRQL